MRLHAEEIRRAESAALCSPRLDGSRAGCLDGDLTAVNGEPARSTDDILKVRDGLAIGDTIRFSVWRDGESFDVDVAMVEFNDVYK